MNSMGIKSTSLLALVLLMVLIPGAASCQAGQSDGRQRKEIAGLVPPELTDTPSFETRVAEMQTQLAPTATLTLTPSPTYTLTLQPSLTPTITETVYKNPWGPQDECLTEIPSPCIA